MPISLPIPPAEGDLEASWEARASPFVRSHPLGVFSDGFLVVGVQGEEFDSHADAGRRMHNFALTLHPATTGKIDVDPTPKLGFQGVTREDHNAPHADVSTPTRHAFPSGQVLPLAPPIGYPAESPEKAKRPLSDVLHWEKY